MGRHRRGRAGAFLAAALLAGTGAARGADTLTDSDGVIRASLCVGAACPASPSFTNQDTIRLQENTLRIHFSDSSTGSYPSTDWRILVNDSSSGGQGYLAFEDADLGRPILTLRAGAPAHALYVGPAGDVGIGTNLPMLELHVVDGNSPALRLEQDGSEGWAPRIWDLGGNELRFFVRDAATNALPFQIGAGAPDKALTVAADGAVGLGTTSPTAPLHIRRDGVAYIRLDDATGAMWNLQSQASQLRFSTSAFPGPEFRLEEDGDLTIAGALTQNSDRANKTAIVPVDPAAMLARVAALEISAWSYRHDAAAGIRHIGPMAQDFHALFGTGAAPTGLSTLDTSGVALAAIQALAAQNAAQRALIGDLAARLERLEAAR